MVATNVFLYGAGQLIAWEGGRLITGTATGGSTTELTASVSTDSLNTEADYYGGRSFGIIKTRQTGTDRYIKITSGTLDGTLKRIDDYAVSGDTATFTAESAWDGSNSPANGDTFTIYPVGDTTGSATANYSDSTFYQDVCVYGNSSTDGRQFRVKAANYDQTIQSAVAVPDGFTLLIEKIMVFVSLGYRLGNRHSDLRHQLQKFHTAPYPWPTVAAAGGYSGTIFDDAMQAFEWRILVDDQVYGKYTGMCALSKLTVPAETIDSENWGAAYGTFKTQDDILNSYARNMTQFPFSPVLGFERDHRIDNFLSRPIKIPNGATFKIQGRCNAEPWMIEYDVHASGVLIN